LSSILRLGGLGAALLRVFVFAVAIEREPQLRWLPI
jgi:hypothetical protein